MGVDDCLLGPSAIAVAATSAAANASLAWWVCRRVRRQARRRSGFNRDGEQWTAVGAPIEINGSSIRYSGVAIKSNATPPESQL